MSGWSISGTLGNWLYALRGQKRLRLAAMAVDVETRELGPERGPG